MRKNTITQMFVGTSPQLLASLIGTISAISDGMQYGWSAPVVPILQAADSPIEITKEDVSWLETLYLIGGIGGLPITIYLVDRVGRKKAILVAAVSSLIAWILIGVANDVSYLYAGRFFGGLAGDVAFVAAPMYVAEIADRKIRGFLAGIIYLMMLLGILVIYALAPFVPFYVPSIVGGSIVVFQLIVFPFMPESPYHLLAKNRTAEAKRALDWFRTTESADRELEEISKAVERQKSERGRPWDLLMVPSNRNGMIVIAVLNASQHFCGITVMLMNIHTILAQAGSAYMSVETAGIIFSAIMLLSGTVADFTIDKFGRKMLLFLSCILTGLSLLVIAIYFNLQYNGFETRDYSWVPIVCVMVYAAVFKFGLGMVPIVMTAELFATKVKAMGMTLGDSMYIIFGLLSVEMYQALVDVYGIHVPFYIFTVIAFCTALFSVVVVPETKGKSLEEIQMKLKNRGLVKFSIGKTIKAEKGTVYSVSEKV